MKSTKNPLRCRRGIQVITAVLMLLLMFTILTTFLVAYFNYNTAAQDQMTFEQQRSQEKLTLSKLTNDQLGIVSTITVTNLGTIESKISAIYETFEGETNFVCDPSTDTLVNMDTHVAPSESITINLSPFAIDARAKVVAATERGVKTFEYVPTFSEEQEYELSDYDPSKLYVGPLMLKFDAFYYRVTSESGVFNPAIDWQPGWYVNTTWIKEKTGTSTPYLAWKIDIMNVGDKNITLNRLTGFNLVQADSPSSLPWYLEPTNLSTKTQFLEINKTETITFIWGTPNPGTSAQKLTFSDCSCMIFLTFFGVYHETDETTTPYAQTIPFEGSVFIK
jgi:archaellum component FlaF (FlaF/FlaG flagellin family)